MSRQRARELELADGELVVAREQLDELNDLLYVVACAVDDTERDLAEAGPSPSARELAEMLDWLLDAARPLRDRRVTAPSTPPGNPS